MGGARDGPDFFNLHRNKRSITLNLKTAEGVAILKKLAATADVLIENYRPDVKHRLGFDYETLRKLNPRLVYVSLSGFGQDGPYGNRPGFDQIAQGMGGLMSITGLPGQGPVRVGIPIADLSSGNYAAMGALIALLERDISGEGQWVQTSLLQAQISMLDFQAARWLVAREVPGQAGNDHPTSHPDRRVPHQRRAHQHRRLRPAHLRALLQGAGRREAARGSRLRHRREALQEPQAPQRGAGRVHQALHERGAGGEAQRGRRAVGADLRDRPDVRRPAGRARRHGRADAASHRGPGGGRQPGGAPVAHALACSTARRPGSASTPRRCWPSSATTRTTSPPCASAR